MKSSILNNFLTDTNGVTSLRGSRRDMLTRWLPLAGAGLAALPALAQSTPTTTVSASDISILNFALTLEQLESAFYTQGLAQFGASDFAGSYAASLLGTGPAGQLYNYLTMISEHEATHVQTLTSTITSDGGTPVAATCYTFPYTDPDTFLMVAMTLENTGVMAYDGAISSIQDTTLQQVAATIATVEARHASFLNLLNAAIPFPSAFDTPESQATILAAAAPFIGTNCPVAPVTPVTKAIAGPLNLTTSSSTAQLDATASTSSNGQALAYLWTRSIASNLATISSPQSAMPTVTFLGGPGLYVFNLQVTDTLGVVSSATVIINYTGT